MKKKRFVSLKTKIIVSFSTIMCLLISIVVFFSSFIYTNKLKENNINLSMKVIDTFIASFDNYLGNIENLSRVLSYNRYLQQYLTQYKFGTPLDYYGESMYKNMEISFELFGNILNTQKEVKSIVIVDNDRMILYKTINSYIDKNPYYKYDIWYENALNHAGSSVVTGPYALEADEEKVFTISRTINNYDNTQNLGVLAININLNVLNQYIHSIENANLGSLIILNNQGETIYTSSNKIQTYDVDSKELLLNQPDIDSILRLKKGAFITKINNERYQVIFSTMQNTDWTVINITPYSEFSKDVNMIQRFVFLVGFFALTATIWITYIISNHITLPIIKLTKHLDSAINEELYVQEPITSNDEIGQMSNSFNQMLEQIKSLIDQTIRDEKIKRKLELTSLQHQINPHFLYNTLDSIIWMVESNDENTIPLIEALSGLFRISLSKGSALIPLAKELEHAKNYMFIQSMRYYNKFAFDIEVDPSLLQYLTPKLILQPLIENSIYHGIKPKKEKSHIEIKVISVGDEIEIKIIDDGIGMDEEKLTHILDSNYIKEHSSSGLGISNVHQRIKLYFGEDYGIFYSSIKNVGTTVTIRIPKKSS